MSLKSDDTCLAKVADDEPIFVLRAQDKYAPTLVRLWAQLVMLENGGSDKTSEAVNRADDMEEWQEKTGRVKCPD